MLVLHFSRSPFETVLTVDTNTEHDQLLKAMLLSCKEMTRGKQMWHYPFQLRLTGTNKWTVRIVRVPIATLYSLLSHISSGVIVGMKLDENIPHGNVTLKMHHMVPPEDALYVRVHDVLEMLPAERIRPALNVTTVKTSTAKKPWYLNGPTRTYSITGDSMKEVQ